MTIDPRERLRQIDPAPVDAEPPSGAIEAVAVIHEIERRMGMEPRETTDQPTITSSPEQIADATSPRTPTPGKPRQWIPALVGAFLVVLVAGVALLRLSGGEDRSPPAATADNAEAIAVAEAYLEARNTYDAQAILDLLTEDASLSEAMGTDVGELAVMMEGERITEFQYSPFACESLPNEGWVTCTYQVNSRFQQIVGYPPIPGTFTFVVRDGRITFAQNSFPFSKFEPNAFIPWVNWLDAEHPGVYEQLYQDGRPVFTPDVRELHAHYLDLYEESVTSQR